jgi:hypothetical protein
MLAPVGTLVDACGCGSAGWITASLACGSGVSIGVWTGFGSRGIHPDAGFCEGFLGASAVGVGASIVTTSASRTGSLKAETGKIQRSARRMPAIRATWIRQEAPKLSAREWVIQLTLT